MTISCAEELRGGLAGLPGLTLAVALTAPDDTDASRQAAAAAFGLEVRAEHDGEPACDWCGRSDPARRPGGREPGRPAGARLRRRQRLRQRKSPGRAAVV